VRAWRWSCRSTRARKCLKKGKTAAKHSARIVYACDQTGRRGRRQVNRMQAVFQRPTEAGGGTEGTGWVPRFCPREHLVRAHVVDISAKTTASPLVVYVARRGRGRLGYDIGSASMTPDSQRTPTDHLYVAACDVCRININMNYRYYNALMLTMDGFSENAHPCIKPTRAKFPLP